MWKDHELFMLTVPSVIPLSILESHSKFCFLILCININMLSPLLQETIVHSSGEKLLRNGFALKVGHVIHILKCSIFSLIKVSHIHAAHLISAHGQHANSKIHSHKM